MISLSLLISKALLVDLLSYDERFRASGLADFLSLPPIFDIFLPSDFKGFLFLILTESFISDSVGR